ncbi:hypothetical protein [Polynucleobacter sp. AP-Titi-500A-B4]|uniref:hypothetical protein n=1 Tax=Polynucleobacter sp. AP-Titi-500A-B4 TaxID=2576923 RepID=UPI001BFD89C2|nr:hypothetical protein [Polynucleobacter sp. AP-Titi-500A-B4]QWE12120.1 hypothetical protein FD968_08365 [Polynucleobacter sp. AP-Titi-500A-B4]
MTEQKTNEIPKPNATENLSKLLNSNFFIWFLSSIIISGGATLYNNSQHHFEAESNKQKEINNSQFEIINRLNSMSYLMKRAKTMGDVKHALSGTHKSLGPVIPEYENVNIAALYFKIYQLSGTRNAEIGAYLRELDEFQLASQIDDPSTPLKDADKNKILNLIHNLKEYEEKQIIEFKR